MMCIGMGRSEPRSVQINSNASPISRLCEQSIRNFWSTPDLQTKGQIAMPSDHYASIEL